jgi:hypothetical protein
MNNRGLFFCDKILCSLKKINLERIEKKMSINESSLIFNNLIITCEYSPEVINELLKKEISIAELIIIFVYGNSEQKEIADTKLKQEKGTLKEWADAYKIYKQTKITKLITQKITELISDKNELHQLITIHLEFNSTKIIKEIVLPKIKKGPFPIEDLLDVYFHDTKSVSTIKKHLKKQITEQINAINDIAVLKNLQNTNDIPFVKTLISNRLEELS